MLKYHADTMKLKLQISLADNQNQTTYQKSLQPQRRSQRPLRVKIIAGKPQMLQFRILSLQALIIEIHVLWRKIDMMRCDQNSRERESASPNCKALGLGVRPVTVKRRVPLL